MKPWTVITIGGHGMVAHSCWNRATTRYKNSGYTPGNSPAAALRNIHAHSGQRQAANVSIAGAVSST